MPAEDLPPNIPQEDDINTAKAALAQYLQWVKSLLEEIVEERGSDLLLDDLRPLAQFAWTDVSARIDELVASLPDSTDDAALYEHGLFGAQLRFKLEVVRFWFTRWREDERFLPKLLTTVDDVLDSIPGGGAVGEFKEAVSASLAPRSA